MKKAILTGVLFTLTHFGVFAQEDVQLKVKVKCQFANKENSMKGSWPEFVLDGKQQSIQSYRLSLTHDDIATINVSLTNHGKIYRMSSGDQETFVGTSYSLSMYRLNDPTFAAMQLSENKKAKGKTVDIAYISARTDGSFGIATIDAKTQTLQRSNELKSLELNYSVKRSGFMKGRQNLVVTCSFSQI